MKGAKEGLTTASKILKRKDEKIIVGGDEKNARGSFSLKKDSGARGWARMAVEAGFRGVGKRGSIGDGNSV